MAFLVGLNESLTSTRGQILLMDPLHHINKVFALISQEERQRSIHPSHNEVHNSLAFSIRGDQPAQRSINNQAKPRFSSSLPQSRFSVNQVSAMESPLDYPSSGSTSQLSLVSSDPVLANMSAAQCQQLMAYFSNQMAAQKLVSAQQSHGDEAEDKFLKKIGKGSKIDGLYVLQPYNVSTDIFCNKIPAIVWHNRLGHIPQLKLDLLSTKFSLAMDKSKSNSCCYICPMAKQKRLKFPISSTVSAHMFTWVHFLKSKSDGLAVIPSFFHMVAYHKLSAGHFYYVMNVSADTEPSNYKQAVKNHLWIKRKQDGSIEKYKARLVARGFTQQEGIDFIDTFSPVAKLVTVKILLALAAIHNWELHQLDVNNAFLNGDLKEEVFMDIPPGYKYSSVAFSTSRLSSSDHSLFTRGSSSQFLALIVYMDDMIIAGPSSIEIQKDLGKLNFFLGIEIARNSTGIVLSQRQYTLKLLEDAGYLGCKLALLPMDPKAQLNNEEGDLLEDGSEYRRLVGRLFYLTITRPDITYVVHKLSQYVSKPRVPHVRAIHHILRYLKASPGKGIFYSSKSSLAVKDFLDADWGSCPDTRKSTT
ncbi:PREDICTED: uncharacterized protein LOC105965936 [Erythranthe guttata]|uniref:uncharacterized protein LOC105965936 n=1 Tax=Erythranthe guttata TaxID=4155 RepID=UPI00064DFB6A|nr:PREDICTED: uncharacterized protein LOC105965936 [Erythranthe guttata]|eukprot:XP_012845936.1 PREDICTED: uncharacterized protein LOC105965936 [Erythranthe guttata]